jgi:hypothetical protein
MFGLMGYPALGIYKSLHSLKSMTKTQKDILAARQSQSEYNAQRQAGMMNAAELEIIQRFAKLRNSKEKSKAM